MTKELMVEVKKLLPQTDIFLGGPEVSYEAEKIMEQYGRANEGTEMGPVIRGIILGKVRKPSASWQSIMQRRAACLEKRCPKQDDGCYPDIQESDRKSSDSAGAADRGRMLKDIPGLLLDTGYTGAGSHCPSVRFRFCMKSRGFPVRGFRISGIRLFIMSPAGDALSGAVTVFLPLIKRSGCGMLTGYCQSYSFSSIVRCRR